MLNHRHALVGGIESPLHPSAAVTATLATMDEIRPQLSIAFPGD